ncbi:hypothetical protein M408DRAFT_12530 [Serendipita vermifera MAFF 305830]|uniref:Uncharacterized protein n=1 Tax=Serendipita vermifera MAFF 305830 TaxID=933852 RepID=A0A0C3AQF1_SERVB|nr:hypothetical protein M408DRAFT_12530 [Serendipita vermifera MAFF 305830]
MHIHYAFTIPEGMDADVLVIVTSFVVVPAEKAYTRRVRTNKTAQAAFVVLKERSGAKTCFKVFHCGFAIFAFVIDGIHHVACLILALSVNTGACQEHRKDKEIGFKHCYPQGYGGLKVCLERLRERGILESVVYIGICRKDEAPSVPGILQITLVEGLIDKLDDTYPDELNAEK